MCLTMQADNYTTKIIMLLIINTMIQINKYNIRKQDELTQEELNR